MTAKNDITGDQIQTRSTTEAYRDNWDKIFKKKEKTYSICSKHKTQDPDCELCKITLEYFCQLQE
jgi:hypothetical protein